MRIPLLIRGRVTHASSADLPSRGKRGFLFRPSPPFRSPLPHPSKIAVISQRFQTGSRVRSFTTHDFVALAAYRPEILAGSLETLREVPQPVCVSKALVIFSNSAAELLGSEDRDWLWQNFAVPVFEQVLDARGRVLAEECEAHSGLHVLSERSWTGMLSTAECDCGRLEPRSAETSLR
ncbi:MAG: hypothetical protein M3Z09_06440 [Acidobacteriota bacterium]|nr:hypothetical protein [Acidobacteriota bacterium]